MSSYRSIYQTATPDFARSARRKHILPTYIIGLILIISAVSAILLQPQQASAHTLMHNDVDCSASAIGVTATCTGNIILKPCGAINVISLRLDTGNWVCYGGALGGRETHGHNGGTVTFNPAIHIQELDPSGWSGYYTTTGQTEAVPFYNNQGQADFADPLTALVVSDDSI
jgi:hypothetical protein